MNSSFFSADHGNMFNTFWNLISFYTFNKSSKIVYIELKADELADLLDIDVKKTVSDYISLAFSTDLNSLDEFTKDEFFWSKSVANRPFKYLLKLGWLVKDIREMGLKNPIQLLQSGKGKYKVHPGSARAIVVSYILPVSTIRCFYVWDKKLDPTPFFYNRPFRILSNPKNFYDLFDKDFSFKHFVILKSKISETTSDQYFNFVKTGLQECYDKFNLNFITVRDSSHWDNSIKDKVHLYEIINFTDKRTCYLSGVKFVFKNNMWIKE
jgi:hypothetical protein